MFESLMKVVLSPVDLAVSAAKDVVNVATIRDDKDISEETAYALNRVTRNLAGAFDSDKQD